MLEHFAKYWWAYLILLIVLLLAGLAFFLFQQGKKLQLRQAESQKQLDAMAQTLSLLVIDKKIMKLKDAVAAGLPQEVYDNTPKYMRRTKLPVVKAKVGPRIILLIADAKVFEMLPLKKEVKVVASGIYITSIKSVRGGIVAAPAPKPKGIKALAAKFNKKKDKPADKNTENTKNKK